MKPVNGGIWVSWRSRQRESLKIDARITMCYVVLSGVALNHPTHRLINAGLPRIVIDGGTLKRE